MKLLISISFLFFFLQQGMAQVNLDSLWNVWNNETEADTNRLNAMHDIIWKGYLHSQPDSALYFAQIQFDFSEEIEDQNWMANALNAQGVSIWFKGDLIKAIEKLNHAKTIYIKTGHKKGLSNVYNNLGSVYKNQGDYVNAILYYQKTMIIQEERNDQNGISLTLNNIGVIHFNQKDYDKTIENCEKSLAIAVEMKNLGRQANALNNLGAANSAKQNYAVAIEFYEKGLKIYTENNDQRGVSQTLNNIGAIYIDMEDYPTALDFLHRSLSIKESIGDKSGAASTLINIATTLNAQGNTNASLNYGAKALVRAKETGHAIWTRDAANVLFKTYKKLKKHQNALDMYELYVLMKDSINSEANQKEVIRQEYKYTYQKQAATDSITNAEAQKVKDALLTAEKAENKQHQLEAKQQKQQAYFLYGGLGLALLFGGFIFNRFRVTNKQKRIIEEQKDQVDKAFEELEEKNTEIMDSINYAKRIQNAILPPSKVVKEYLQESFILYKPKDVVAGDFYWLEHRDGKVLFAAADCTGHGVPGAMVSVVCNNGLNRSVREYGLTDPGQILDKTREIVIQEFEKSEDEVKDGMDIALCSLERNTLKYSGAHNPLWIIRKGEVQETKANKQPIGKFDKQSPYTTHTFELEKGDSIYIFSDGYVDQFGGVKGKKFKSKAFRTLLLSIQDKSMEEQRVLIDSAFETWRGSLEQIDDVCVIGVRV